ncbi:hypothetical protein GCM10027037_32270 [Mucilaginibacter koreensis]
MQSIWQAVSHILGITIIHSLWQGLLIYMFIRMCLFCFPEISAKSKYRLLAAGMFSLTLWFLYTLLVQLKADVKVIAQPLKLTDALPSFEPAYQPLQAVNRYEFDLNIYLPYITFIYVCGFIISSCRMGYAWYHLGLAKRFNTIATALQIQANNLAVQHFNLKRPVRLIVSEYVNVPCVMGHLKPVLLLPVTLSTGLSATEIEAILLHELAHISRNDFLLNLFQQLATTLLFFNPFAQLFNRYLNEERENCCDDIVVSITGQPLVYAQALLKLETNRQVALQLAMAATGKKYHLFNRIQRIMKTPKPSGNLRHLLLSLLAVGISFGSIAWINPELKDGKLSVKIEKPAIISRMMGDTIRPKPSKIASKPSIKTISGRKYRKGDNPELDRLSAEIEKHANKVGKYYSSPEFTKYAEEMGKEGAKIAEVYNTPEMQHLISQQAEMAVKVAMQQPDKETQARLNQQLADASKQLAQSFATPEFQRMSAQLGMASAKLAGLNTNSAAYKKQMAEITRLSQSIGKISSSPEAIKAQEQIGLAASQMAKQYTSTDWKQQQENIHRLSDSIAQAYKGKFDGTSKVKMQELEAKMKAYQQNPKMKQEQQELQKASKKLQEYLQSPAYKQWLKEHPEKAMKEQPEQLEQPEAKEQPEKTGADMTFLYKNFLAKPGPRGC